MAASAIVAEGLRKRFGEVTALGAAARRPV
jgi:hypothetical protein